MSDVQYRALVVDDDPAICKLTALALGDEGFTCVVAGDGRQAAEQIRKQPFDLVITDLAMPLRHGHSIAVELLAMPTPPVIAVLTGIAEPRLVKDLLARGVDDVIAKPVNFAMLAAKLKSMVGRRKRQVSASEATAEDTPPTERMPFEIDTWTERLKSTSQILPLSCIALDVYDLASKCDANPARIAAALERDASLVAEVLRIANGKFYDRGGNRIVDVEDAVRRIGQKRVGEIALATNALGAITGVVVPWMNISVLWRRSIAAGVALEILTEQRRERRFTDGLLAAAIMHAQGRLVLASLYPTKYEELIECCRTSGDALSAVEAQVFPEPHTAAMARLLEHWNVPSEIYESVDAIGRSYDQLALVSEPARTKAELLKVAVLIGELAVGRWESWDLLEFPPASVLDRLGIHDIGDLIERTSTDLEAIVRFRVNPSSMQQTVGTHLPNSQPEGGQISCRNACPTFGPVMAPLLRSLGIRSVEPSADTSLVANCIGLSSASVRAYLATLVESPTLILVDEAVASVVSPQCATVCFPCSYAQLQAACVTAVHDPSTV